MPPTVDEVAFRDLYRKSEYAVETADGWTLVVTRYEPAPQPFHQPLFGEPLLLVHGFSQNRHAWTSGEFVKNLLYFGLDIHIVELRGHGKSNAAAPARAGSESTGRPLPPDLDYGWDLDSYLLHDLPAAVAAVKARHRARAGLLRAATPWEGCSATGTPGSTTTSRGWSPSGLPRTSGGGSFCSASSRSPRPSPARSSTPG